MAELFPGHKPGYLSLNNMQTILKNWTPIRIVRLIAGIVILGYGITIIDWPLILIGSVIGAMAIANTACGPFSNSCDIEPKKKNE